MSPITLRDSTTIKFHIYSSIGELIYSSERMNNDFKLVFKDDLVDVEINDLDRSLAPGRYELELTPSSWQIPSGAYYMIMETKNTVYNTNFIYKKE